MKQRWWLEMLMVAAVWAAFICVFIKLIIVVVH